MPPKAEKKKQQKIIQDRTFGLKNKNKSKAVQKFVKGVENTVKNSGKSPAQLQAQKFEKQKLKKKQQQEQALLNSLYRDVNKMREESEQEEQDPKNTVCPYFKQGLCQKGKKCIYSHDLTLDRNEQIDLYVDQRTQLIMNQIGTKNLNQLSQQQLSKMITQKQKDYIKGAKSEIVCKFFLDAVEKGKYGWNWTCANGGDTCKYKHCLPPGYVLNRDGGGRIQIEEVNIEQKIDEQRNKLLSENKSSPLVTYDLFLKWKQSKILKKKQQQQKKKKQQQKKNKNKATLRTGKQLFTLDPTLFIDDQQAADDYDERQQIQEEEEELKMEQNRRQDEQGQGEQGEEKGQGQGQGQEQGQGQGQNQQKQQTENTEEKTENAPQ